MHLDPVIQVVSYPNLEYDCFFVTKKKKFAYLQVLYYAMTFYIMQDFIGAGKLMEKLDECLSVAQEQGSKKATKEELPWVVTATELILNYAPSDSTFIRTAAQSAFK